MNKQELENLNLPGWMEDYSNPNKIKTEKINKRINNKILKTIEEIELNKNYSNLFGESEKIISIFQEKSDKQKKTINTIVIIKDIINSILYKNSSDKLSIYELFKMELHYNAICAEEIIERLTLLEKYIFGDELKGLSSLLNKAIQISNEINDFIPNLEDNKKIGSFELFELYINQKRLYITLKKYYESIISGLTNLSNKSQHEQYWINKCNEIKGKLDKENGQKTNGSLKQDEDQQNIDNLLETLSLQKGISKEILMALIFINNLFPNIEELKELSYPERLKIKINGKGLCYIATLFGLKEKGFNPVARNHEYKIFVEKYESLLHFIKDLKNINLTEISFDTPSFQKKTRQRIIKNNENNFHKILNKEQFKTVLVLFELITKKKGDIFLKIG